jgi:hypothetical protein
MRLTIKNGDDWQREHTRGFCKWFETKYLSGVKDIVLRVIVVPYDDNANIGECANYDSGKDPRHFVIKIGATEDMSKREFIMALGHEMVHLKQYALNELRDNDRKRITMWKRKAYSFDMEYWDQPWEIEAYGMERGLLHRYAEFAGFYEEVVARGYD